VKGLAMKEEAVETVEALHFGEEETVEDHSPLYGPDPPSVAMIYQVIGKQVRTEALLPCGAGSRLSQTIHSDQPEHLIPWQPHQLQEDLSTLQHEPSQMTPLGKLTGLLHQQHKHQQMIIPGGLAVEHPNLQHHTTIQGIHSDLLHNPHLHPTDPLHLSHSHTNHGAWIVLHKPHLL